jgi:hypothetical protein
MDNLHVALGEVAPRRLKRALRRHALQAIACSSATPVRYGNNSTRASCDGVDRGSA